MIDVFVIITILLVMFIIMFLLIKKTVKDINHNSKEYYLLKLQDYDNLVNDNKEKNNKIENENENEEIKSEIEHDDVEKFNILLESNPEYQIDNFLRLAKDIDKEFDVDINKVITNFINGENIDNNVDYYNHLLIIKDRIDNIGLYNLTVSSSGFVNLLKEINQIDNLIVKKYKISSYKNNIMDFYSFLKNEIKCNDPTIYIEVGDKNMSFNNINNNIKTIYNPNIYKGIIIKYKNNMYDYSLSF